MSGNFYIYNALIVNEGEIFNGGLIITERIDPEGDQG